MSEEFVSHVVQFPKLGLEFTVTETAFTIGSFKVQWYGAIIAVGFLLAVLYAFLSVKKMNIDMNRLIDAVLVGMIGSIVCARLYYVFFYPNNQKYFENPLSILDIHSGGMAIYGAIIGALLFGGLTAKLRKMNVLAVFDLASLGFLIGQGVGRWGNFVNQEAFGTATDLPWGMYSDNTVAVVGGAAHPCFLYESLLCLLGFVLLHIFTRKFRRYDGQTFLLYIIWYGACRFFIEGIRTDSLMIPYVNLRVSQVLAAACVLVGVILLIAFRHRTSLTGCGSRPVMEGVGITEAAETDDASRYSTIFGDLPPQPEEKAQEKETSEEAGKAPEEPEQKDGEAPKNDE